MMTVDHIKNVLIIGSGTMGCQIGLQIALHGYKVTLYDVNDKALESTQALLEDFCRLIVNQGYAVPEDVKQALARISMTTDAVKAAENADLVSESVPEDPKLKGEVFGKFNELCPNHTIFTTNTSTLVPSMYAEQTGRPERFLAFHFHGYVWQFNIVDVMPHPGTAPEIVDIIKDFAKRIGQIPIILRKEHHAYLFNEMLGALNTAAVTMAVNGVASVEDIDRAWMGVMKFPIGPFGIMDQVGLTTVWKIVQFWADAQGDPQLQKNAQYFKSFIDQGKLGIKSGQGFYTYPNPAFVRPDFVSGE